LRFDLFEKRGILGVLRELLAILGASRLGSAVDQVPAGNTSSAGAGANVNKVKATVKNWRTIFVSHEVANCYSGQIIMRVPDNQSSFRKFQ
jgi:hypothetical protein